MLSLCGRKLFCPSSVSVQKTSKSEGYLEPQKSLVLTQRPSECVGDFEAFGIGGEYSQRSVVCEE
jgi:hypothetical protein